MPKRKIQEQPRQFCRGCRVYKAKLSGFLFKGIPATRARDADLPFAAGDAHDLLAARAAEKGVILPLAKAALEQTERTEKAVPMGKVLPVFFAPGGDLPGEDAHIAPDQQGERRRGKDGGEESTLSAHSHRDQDAYASAYGKKPAECVCTVTTGHEGREIPVGGTTPHK